jgi:hypothetical protein
MRLDIHNFATLADAVVWAKDLIDIAAGAARARYLTVTPGQDATYSAKYADAKAFVLAGYPDAQIANYPWVKAEAAGTGKTNTQAADSIKGTGDAWNIQIGPAIESLRIGGKQDLTAPAITTIPQVVASCRATTDKLGAI